MGRFDQGFMHEFVEERAKRRRSFRAIGMIASGAVALAVLAWGVRGCADAINKENAASRTCKAACVADVGLSRQSECYTFCAHNAEWPEGGVKP